MKKEITTFIFGAGVSSEYGYPTGRNLKDIILNNCKYHPQAHSETGSVFKSYHKDYVEEFANAFIKSDNNSIDFFLKFNYKKFGEVGKFLISKSILDVEKNNPSLIKNHQTIYNYIFNSILTDINILDNKKIQFITFNYDLSLEQYLYNYLKYTFNLTDNKAIQYFNLIEIIHIHGKVGDLDFMSENGRVYGNTNFESSLIKIIASNIRIIHEVDGFSDELIQIQEKIYPSKYIFILGFGYHPDNIKNLDLFDIYTDRYNEGNSIITHASRYGKTDSEIENIKRMFFQESGLSGNFYFHSQNHKNIDVLKNSKHFQIL